MSEQPSEEKNGQDPQQSVSPPPPPSGYYPPPSYPQQKSGSGMATRVLTGIIGSVLLVSLILNFYLGVFFVSSMRGPQETVWAQGDGLTDDRVVILPVEGMIDGTTARFIRRSLRALSEEDNRPVAVVLRVESGGGTVSASDQIWHRIKQFQAHTGVPVVTSFGQVAASGGYYIAAPTDYIFAEPTSLTGSIGVIAQAFTFADLLDKVGVKPEVITSSAATSKDMLNPLRDWTDADRTKLRNIIDQAHERFVHVVDQGRDNLSAEQVKALATGEVFTVRSALDNGLVDGEGYIDNAIAKGMELAGRDPADQLRVTVMNPQPAGLLGLLGASSQAQAPKIDADQVRKWAGELSMPRLEYRWLAR